MLGHLQLKPSREDVEAKTDDAVLFRLGRSSETSLARLALLTFQTCYELWWTSLPMSCCRLISCVNRIFVVESGSICSGFQDLPMVVPQVLRGIIPAVSRKVYGPTALHRTHTFLTIAVPWCEERAERFLVGAEITGFRSSCSRASMPCSATSSPGALISAQPSSSACRLSGRGRLLSASMWVRGPPW